MEKGTRLKIFDTTGVIISKSGRARDRGQHEVDNHQYDNLTSVQAVSAAGAMYRASALQATSYKLQAHSEFFDEDFHSYWEDVDLTWRMSNAGWKNIFVPSAIGYHGRAAGGIGKRLYRCYWFYSAPQKTFPSRPPTQLQKPHFYVHKKFPLLLPAVFCPRIFYVFLYSNF